MDLRLAGKSALVTGGTRGIGRGITLALARAGCRVVACYRGDEAAAEAVSGELKEIGADFRLVRADVTVESEISSLVAEASEFFDGRLDTLVHNAGSISHIPVGELSSEEFSRVVDTSLTAAFLLTRESLPLLSEGSSVVFLGSRSALVGIPLRSHYTAAKAGLIGLARSLAKEYGPRKIRFNVVAPGLTETEEFAKLGEEQRAGMKKRYGDLIALQRFGTPDEIADVVLFVASDLARYVTGETINVDGGI